MKYQSVLMQMKLKSCVHYTLVEQIEKNKDTTMTSETSLKFCRAIVRCKEYLSEHSRTAKLWIQYIHYINIVKQFIRAERTGN